MTKRSGVGIPLVAPCCALEQETSSLLSCQPRVTVTSCFVYNVIRYLESMDHVYINPIRRKGLIHTWSVDSHKLKRSVKVDV